MPGVAFSVDPDTLKDYSLLNYHSWLWEELVSWNVTGTTIKIFNWTNLEYIENLFHKKLFIALGHIKKEFWIGDIDIEYCYDWQELFLLQVRPITIINWKTREISDVAERYVNFIHYILNFREKIYWNMIDVNPEELIWNDTIISQTFFEEIFTKSSLLDAREDLWYFRWDNFLKFILNKPYVDLEENIITFLPNTLDKKEVQIFINYYKKIINLNPLLQNKLDSQLYPNTIEIVILILNEEWVDNEMKSSIIDKFTFFFIELNSKFIKYTWEFWNIEKKLIDNFLNTKKYTNYASLIFIEEYDCSIDDLLCLIKETTYYFTIFARIFFFLSNFQEKENSDFFKQRIYSSQINEIMCAFELSGAKFNISKWFDFTDLIKQELITDRQITYDPYLKYGDWNSIDIAKVARENLKFIFMNMFRVLWNKIRNELSYKWRNLDDMRSVWFNFLLSYLKWEISDKQLELEIVKWKKKSEISKTLDLPSVIAPKSKLIDREILSEKWFFVWKWILKGTICIISDISDFQIKDYKDKIIIIQNATPEMDVYLKYIKWVVTKNWGPLAHIMIRARELDIPAVVGSSYYDELASKDGKQVYINFENQVIDVL